MLLEEEVLEAKGDPEKIDALIRKLHESQLIISYVGHITKQRISADSEIYQIALIATYSAIQRFDINRSENPNFRGYLYFIIRDRVNKFRKEENSPRPFPLEDDELLVYNEKYDESDVVYELLEFEELLKTHGYSLREFQQLTPRRRDARANNWMIARQLIKSGHDESFLDGTAPLSVIAKSLGQSKRTLQRHRRHIEMLILFAREPIPLLKRWFDSSVNRTKDE